MSLQLKNNQNKINLSHLKDEEILKILLHLYDNKKFEEVIRLADRVNLKISHQYWVHFLRGSSFYEIGIYEKAFADIKKCLDINPNAADCYFKIGNICQETKNIEEAELFYNKAISIKENYAEPYANLGKLYKDIGDFERSKKHLDKAIEINPKFSRAYNFLGSLAEAQNNINDAESYYKKASSLNSSYYEPVYNLSLAQLYNCKFKEGFKNYNSRWKNSSFSKKRLQTNQPIWSPSVTTKCHVTIWPEQGIGDFILYSRFFPDLIKNTKNLTIIAYDKTISLHKRSFPNINFVSEINTENIDFHVPIGDLAKFYVNSSNDVKERSNPYLVVDKYRTKQIKQLLPKGKKICGISWVSKNEVIGQNKSMTLEDMKDLLLLPNITFVDLQYTDTTDERAEFKKKYGVEIVKLEEIDNFNDIDGLASLIDACDFVVSVSNTTVHISGAIGKKTFLMLPIGRGRLWYWSKENNQSIWYKSIQIIQQDQFGSWDNVIKKIKTKLDNTQLSPQKLSLDNELKMLVNLFNKGHYEEIIERGEFLNSYYKRSHILCNIIGSSYLKIKNYEKAKYFHEKSIKLNPKFHEGFHNLGYTYWELGELDLAEKYCSKSLKLKPNYVYPLNTLGAVFKEKSEYKKAEKYFKKAIEIDKNYLKPKYNLFLHYAYIGKFKEAWNYFENRWQVTGVQNKVNELSGLRWNLKLSKSVNIWAEQGIGDFILYSRFLNDLILSGTKVRVLIDKKIKSIFERTFPQIEFVIELNKNKLDFHAPIGDLAKFYVNSFDDIKERSNPYLVVDKYRTKQIKQLLPKGKKICGISWISKNKNVGQNKSMTLEDMKDLLISPNITFVDLQYTDTTDERVEFKKKYGVEIVRLEEIDNLNDIDGLASLIDACDFVVSVSNTTAHISGAIGKKTYLMLPKNRGQLWYWSKENAKSIWYKSIEIFERNNFSNWETVIKKIKQKLKR